MNDMLRSTHTDVLQSFVAAADSENAGEMKLATTVKKYVLYGRSVSLQDEATLMRRKIHSLKGLVLLVFVSASVVNFCLTFPYI